MSDDYVEIEAHVTVCRRDAVRISNDDGAGWCPRSVLHAATDAQVEDAVGGGAITIKLRRWKAEELEMY